MFTSVRWFVFAGLSFLAVSGCGGGDESGKREDPSEMPVAGSCSTLKDLPCSCPAGGYGKTLCDGTCTMCPPVQAGTSGAAGTPAGTGASGSRSAGFAGRSGGEGGRGTLPPVAGAPAPGPGPGPSGAAGTGAAGMAPAAGAPAAGSGGMPMAGMPATGGTGEVPASPVCMPVSMWNPEWSAFEVEVLRLVNENRAKGWNCDTEGMKPAAGPLTMEPTLRCSARLHSKDMADQMYFAHESLDGRNPGARMTAAGYVGRTWGENIAKGQQTPAQVVQGWMDSDGHCSNIMNATFTLIGVGYFAGMGSNPRFNSELYWTQNFGAAASGGRPRP